MGWLDLIAGEVLECRPPGSLAGEVGQTITP